MKKPLSNPQHKSKWDAEDSARLLAYYYKIYQNSYQDWENESYRPPKFDRMWFSKIRHYGGCRIKWYVLHELYVEGHLIRQQLACDFSEFCNYMINGVPKKIYDLIPDEDGKHLNHYIYWRWRAKVYFVERHFRVQQKFKQSGTVKPKVKDDRTLANEEWREVTGMNKDKAKCGYRRRSSCPKEYKRKFNKQHRQWQRDNINHENWEELMNHYKWKELANPWDWD